MLWLILCNPRLQRRQLRHLYIHHHKRALTNNDYLAGFGRGGGHMGLKIPSNHELFEAILVALLISCR